MRDGPAGGRPRIAPGEDSVPLSLRVPQSLYDAAARAAGPRQDLAAFIRAWLAEGRANGWQVPRVSLSPSAGRVLY